jgi:hypothetical protein
MVAVPAATPVTIPVLGPTVATPVDPELHVPPEVVLLNVEVLPVQIVDVPVFAVTALMTFAVVVV